jgi:hypothetical protein
MAVEQVGRCAVLLESLLTDINALSNPQDLLSFKKDFAFANGTGANQADKRWSSAGRSLGSTAADTFDLSATSANLIDYRGNAITFARIKGIAIYNSGPNMIQLGAGSNPLVNWIGAAGDIVNIRSGGLFLLLAPDATAYAVTTSTADILRVLNSAAGTITYDIALLGASV